VASFDQQIIDATRSGLSEAKVLEFDHAVKVSILVERAFAVAS
jgi:hypothetical protein